MIHLTSTQLSALVHIQNTGRCVGLYRQTTDSLFRLELIDLRGGASLTDAGAALLNSFRSDLGTRERAALEACKEMIDIALPQFNWGASALSADAIRLLNETPTKVNAALGW